MFVLPLQINTFTSYDLLVFVVVMMLKLGNKLLEYREEIIEFHSIGAKKKLKTKIRV